MAEEQEKQTSFRRIWKKFIGWTSLLLVVVVAIMLFTANWQLKAAKKHATESEAKFAATIADRDAQITILRNALNRTTSDLSSRESLIARLNLRSEEHTSELQSLRHLVC